MCYFSVISTKSVTLSVIQLISTTFWKRQLKGLQTTETATSIRETATTTAGKAARKAERAAPEKVSPVR